MDKNKPKTPFTVEEKKERNKQQYLKFIERCRNHEYLTKEERKTQDIDPEEKKAAAVARRKITRMNYTIRNRVAINAYQNNLMKEKYKNNEPYRLRELERGKERHRKRVEQRRMDELAKSETTEGVPLGQL